MSGSDGRPAGDQAGGYGGLASPGGIPPSFGAPSSPPPPPPAAPGPAPAAPGLAPAVPPPSGPSPTAGPFANPSTPARRRLPGPGLPRFAGPAGTAARARARGSGRGTLANVLLFGAGPLALAGIIVAAFVFVGPARGGASNAGFQAGPAPSTQQAAPIATVSPSASASPTARKKKHPHATATASRPDQTPSRPSQSAGPKPVRKAGAVTPHNLGRPNFAGYCQHIGHGPAELAASNAYGWRCTQDPNQALTVVNVCAWTYHLSTGQVIDVSANYYDPGAWQCWRVNRDLGVLDVAKYCAAAAHGTSKLVANNAYGWYCTSPSAPVNTTTACDTVYHVSNAVSRFAVFASPYFWQCWD